MRAFARSISCFSILLITGCATYGPTQLIMDPATPSVALSSGTVDIVAQMNYLKYVDSVNGSQRSDYARDKRLIEGVISSELKQIGGGEGMQLIDTATSGKARFRCDITVHQFVAWEEILFILLPIPTSNNESIYVEATLFDTERKQEIKKYEEWGYNKQVRFFIFEGRDNPPMSELRTFLVRKVLRAVAMDVSLASQGLATSTN